MSQSKQNGTGKTEIQPETVAIKYIRWYLKNAERLNRIPFVSDGPTENYSVDFQAAEEYFSELKKSGYVSEKYIDNFRQYFQEADRQLKKYPQKEGFARGFEFDIVLQAQDYMTLENHINQVKTISKKINGNVATIRLGVKSFKMRFTLTKEKGRWLVDSYKH